MSGLPQTPAVADLMAAMQLQIDADLQRETHLTGVIEVLKSLLEPGGFRTDLALSPGIALIKVLS